MNSRNRFLNTVLKDDRLNVAIDVRVPVLCGMPDAATSPRLATPPPTLQTLSIISHNIAPVPETLRSRVLLLSATRHCMAGFLCCIVDDPLSVLPNVATFFLTTTLECATLMHISYCCHEFVDGSL